MVRAITTIVCSLLLLLSFSCSREDTGPQETIPGSGIVTFTAMTGQGETRSSQEGSFETGDAIGVFAIEPKTGVYWAVNNKYTYDGQKFKPEAEADNIIVTVFPPAGTLSPGKGQETQVSQACSRVNRKPTGGRQACTLSGSTPQRRISFR